MDRNDRGVIFSWIVDRLGVAERCVRIKEVITASSKCDPFRVRLQATHLDTKAQPSILNLGRHTSAPLIEGLPSALDRANNALLKMGTVLLHDNDALLQSVFFVHLTLQLAEDGHVGGIGIFLGRNTHGCILEEGDRAGQIGDHLCRHLAFLSYAVGQLARVLLHVFDMGFDFGAKLLQMLDDGSLNCFGEICVMIGDDSSLVADSIVDILNPSFTKELIAFSEGDLNDTTKLCQFFGSIVLDISDAFKVAN